MFAALFATLRRHPLLGALAPAFVLSLGALGGSWAWQGLDFMATVAILAVLEFTFSFDNAVVNSKILQRMSPFWQTMFLILGIAVAVFFMRLAFPLVIVMLTAHLGLGTVWDLAVNHPGVYATELQAAHPAIAAFGGMFLLMIFLDWLFDERELHWLGKPEAWLNKIGKEDIFASMLALLGLWVVAQKLAGSHTEQVFIAGVAGWLAYQAVNLLDKLTEAKADAESIDEVAKHGQVKLASGVAGFILFLKLEMIDASFSFDGVTGAFAITSDFFAILIGLAIGAFYIRSLTVYLTRQGTLGEYVFLEHGAHWAIGALAFILLGTMQHELNQFITGSIGLFLIAASYVSSLAYKRRHPEIVSGDEDTAVPAETTPAQ
jgi:hypothetical protein